MTQLLSSMFSLLLNDLNFSLLLGVLDDTLEQHTTYITQKMKNTKKIENRSIMPIFYCGELKSLKIYSNTQSHTA